MDPNSVMQIAKDLAPILAPFLPYLIKGIKLSGAEFAKSLGGKSGEEVPEVIKQLWKKIEPKINEEPGAKKAVERVVENPNDNRVVGAFELILEEILKDNNTRNEIIKLLSKAKGQGINIRSVAKIETLRGNLVAIELNNPNGKTRADIDQELDIKTAERGSKTTVLKVNNPNRKKRVTNKKR
jgi:hypothetical protein